MATSPLRLQQGYGIGNALQPLPPFSIIANRVPTQQDKARIGTFWVYTALNNVYVLTSVTGGNSNWLTLSNGGAGVFISLTVTTGPNTIAGLTTFNGNVVFNGNITQTAGTSTLLATTVSSLTCNGDLVTNNGSVALNPPVNPLASTLLVSGNNNPAVPAAQCIAVMAGQVFNGLRVLNNSAAAGSGSVMVVGTVSQAAATGGDPYLSIVNFNVTGVNIGIDTSDNKFAMGTGALGANDFYQFDLTTADTNILQGNLRIVTAGKTLAVQGGAVTDFIGQAVLAAGTATVNNTNITVNDKIFLSVSLPGGTQGFLSYAIAAGASFTITSTNALDTSTVEYFIVRQI
jgi:hypothetical protein